MVRLRRVRQANEGTSIAVWAHGRWIPLAALPGSPRLARASTNLLALLGGGPDLLNEADQLASAPDAPTAVAHCQEGLPFQPTGLRDCSLWESHLVDAARALLALQDGPLLRAAVTYERLRSRPFPPLRPRRLWHEQPLYYKGAVAGCIGDGDIARWPAYAQALDYELEIAVLITRTVTDLQPDEAMDAVGGFLLLNDISARDVQYREMVEGRMGPAKSKDFATAVGPVVVTPDEFLPLLGKLTGEVLINGRSVATGSTAGMRHSVSEVVAYASAGEQLRVGEVIGLGTVPGCSGLESGVWVSPGDEVELRAGPLGSLRTRIGQPEPWCRAAGPLPRSRWSVVCRAGEAPDPRGVQAARWRPPPAPSLSGPLSPNTVLDEGQQFPLPGGTKPEDVVLDAAGRLYTGVEDGRIYRWPADATPKTTPELLADTHGRPLGLEIDPRDGSLVVCDAYRGLLRLSADGQLTLLADQYRGRRFRFVNNAAVARDGTVYFSDSSTRFRIEHYVQELLEHQPNGRIFCLRPDTGQPTLVADGLYFPNGLALTPDESGLLVCETGTYRLLRFELAGNRAGQRSTLVELPGFPDNMSAVGDGTYWVAIPSLRLPAMDLAMRIPTARRVVARLPQRLQPAAKRYGLVLHVDGDGRILRSLHGPTARYCEITGIRQHDGWLYLGSLVESSVGRVAVPDLSEAYPTAAGSVARTAVERVS